MAMTDLMTRINRIFDGLVGCQLEFQPASALNTAEWKPHDLEILRKNRATLPRFVESSEQNTIGFPINLHGAFAGLAVVRGWKDTRPRRLLQLAELFTLVLEAGFQQEERRDRLRLIEERLSVFDETSNVIPLRPARFGRVLQLIDTNQLTPAQPSPLTTLPLLIETSSGFPLNRVAIEIHNMSGRWAFIDAKDLPKDIFDSRENLEQLGAMTIFIKDITQLSESQQKKLAEYLSIKPNGDTPHVIAGAYEPVAELAASGRVLEQLLDLFCVSNLQWTDKTPEQVTVELINASLRHLLEQTRETHQHGEHFIPFHIQYLDPDQTTVH
jgi:hypothetical protein